MNKPQSNSPRARLQQLRAIPDRDRTEEEWDELNELEIMLAAENRHPGPGQGQGQGQGNRPKGGAPSPHGKPPPPGPHGNQPQRKFHKRPRRRKGPPGPNG